MPPKVIAIVGASLAGVTVAQALRDGGSDAEIVLIGDEPELPYDRPPLSKDFLDHPTFAAGRLLLHDERWYRDNQVRLRLGCAATALDLDRRTVTGANGERVAADAIVLATGSRPLVPAGVAPDPDVLVLRTWADARALRARLGSPGRLLVIGAGFLGLEAVARALRLGWSVTVVERGPAALGRVLPPELAELCWRPYATAGVALVTDATVVATVRTGGGLRTALADGRSLDSDAVLVAAGTVPNVGLLTGTALADVGGVACDGRGRTAADGLWAVGDVACWPNDWTGAADRAEHWHSARSQAVIAANAIDGPADPATRPWSEPPYFWSDLLGGRVQFVGSLVGDADGRTPAVHVLPGADGRRVALTEADGVLRGVFAIGAPRMIAQARALLQNVTALDTALRWARGGATAPTPPA